MSQTAKPIYEFGPFRVDAVKRLLWRDGAPVALTSKCFETLLALLEGRGGILEKDFLLSRVWPDAVVEEKNLTMSISTLRKALGESPQEHRYIVTVPGRGYRFVAEVRPESPAVEEVEDAEAELIVQRAKLRVVVDEEEESGGVGERGSGRAAALPAALSLSRARQAGLAIALLTLLLTAVAYWWRAGNKNESAIRNPQSAIKSLAVLPFKSLNPPSQEDYLGVGLADVTITRLGSLNQLIVRPTRAVLPFAAQDPVQAGQTLKVDAVLDGSIQQEGQRVRVTLRLLRVADGKALWVWQGDEAGADVFALQDAIARKVTEALALKLTEDEHARLAKRYTENSEAYQLYLKGRYFYDKRTAADLQKALEYFQQATERDPHYALAWAGLADTYLNLPAYSSTTPSGETYLKAKAAAARAVQMDDQLAEAYVSLAFTSDRHEWDWTAAERAYRRALELNPNLAAAHHRFGMHLLARGRFDEALTELERAQALDPLSLIIGVNVAMRYIYARQYDQAIEQLRKTLELEARFPPAHEVLGWAYEGQGLAEQALAEYLQAQALSGARAETVAALKAAGRQAGLRGYYQQQLRLLSERAGQSYVSPLHRAALHARLGETAQALAQLEKALAERNADMMTIRVDWHFESLRAEPRFADLLRRVGLSQ